MRRTVLVLALALTAACGQKPAATAAAKPAPSSAASAASAVPQAPQPALTSVTGIVEETLDASDYTYMRLKTESGGETWAAITKAKVQKGERVTVVNAMAMDGFESKTLNRKFDHIVFGALEGGKAGAAPAPVSAHGAPANASKGGEVASPHAAVSDGKADAMDVKVPKAEGKDAYTIAQVFADRAKLKDKIVAVRGKVVKANGGIMGRNWYHIRDGSGSREKKDDDLTVTSNDPAIVGDVVVVKGVVHVEKDFGAGYQYPVVVEDAKVTKEPASTRADASR
ncbi:MAG: nucleotide-binding protein [Acidobacteriota bacterium]|nr:nucleotide-binding protein [Acidobacteriota bacterium]